MATPGGLVLRDRRSDALRVWWDARQAHRHGPEAIRARHRDRLAELVGFAREHSAYYRRLYQGLPGRIEDVTVLPVTDKAELMAHFDEVSTDPSVTRAAVEAFVADPARIGERFAEKYLVATTAGTTGTRGIFVLDDRYWAVASGLMAQLTEGWTVLDRTSGVELFQVVQTMPTSVAVRLRPTPGADSDRVWAAALAGITGLLTDLDLAHVTVERAADAPGHSPGGKYRTVIPLAPEPPSP